MRERAVHEQGRAVQDGDGELYEGKRYVCLRLLGLHNQLREPGVRDGSMLWSAAELPGRDDLRRGREVPECKSILTPTHYLLPGRLLTRITGPMQRQHSRRASQILDRRPQSPRHRHMLRHRCLTPLLPSFMPLALLYASSSSAEQGCAGSAHAATGWMARMARPEGNQASAGDGAAETALLPAPQPACAGSGVVRSR